MATSKDIYPTWKITKEFTCPIGMEISYKYIVKEGSNIYWEELNKDRRVVIQNPGNLISEFSFIKIPNIETKNLPYTKITIK